MMEWKFWGYAFLPFGAFLLGYTFIALLVRQESIVTPTLVGQPLVDAVLQLSARQLNARILAQHEDTKVTPGTVLDQMPAPGQKIKPHQPVFLVVSQQPARIVAPALCGLERRVAEGRAQALGVRLKVYELPGKEPAGTIIAQTPSAGGELPIPRAITVYVSTGKQAKLQVMPILTGKPVRAVQKWLKGQDIRFEATGDTAPGAVISSQRPLAGSLVDPADRALVVGFTGALPVAQ